MVGRLVSHVPTRVGVVQDVDYAGLVPDITRVVEGKEVAMVVEGKFLGVSQAMGIDFEIRPVGIATEDGPATGGLVVLPSSSTT